jgi:hypothetical protein
VREIGNRIRRLESILIPAGAFDRWGKMAAVRDDLIRRAAPAYQAELRRELEELGPTGVWREMARHFLADHGFTQTERESLAETMARALDIGTENLRVLIAEGRIGKALTARFQ